MGDQLTPQQRRDLRELVNQHRDVFSAEAGRTDLVHHRIVTEPGKKVKLRPYRIPEARREAVRREVRTMLETGVIEASHSEWCSPIVLVPKPDGTIRFCNDFRQVCSEIQEILFNMVLYIPRLKYSIIWLHKELRSG